MAGRLGGWVWAIIGDFVRCRSVELLKISSDKFATLFCARHTRKKKNSPFPWKTNCNEWAFPSSHTSLRSLSFIDEPIPWCHVKGGVGGLPGENLPIYERTPANKRPFTLHFVTLSPNHKQSLHPTPQPPPPEKPVLRLFMWRSGCQCFDTMQMKVDHLHDNDSNSSGVLITPASGASRGGGALRSMDPLLRMTSMEQGGIIKITLEYIEMIYQI